MSYYKPPAGGGGLTIGDVKADPDIADSLTKKHAQYTDLISSVVLGATFAVNQVFHLLAGIAQPVTSLDTAAPFVDGVILVGGGIGDTRSVAMLQGNRFTTPTALPAGSPLWLGQDGMLTDVVPSLGAGDVWMVLAAHRDDATHFTLDPEEPVKL